MTKEQYEGRKAKGLCPKCEQPKPNDGYVACGPCRGDQVNYNHVHRAKQLYRTAYYVVVEGGTDPRNGEFIKTLRNGGFQVLQLTRLDRAKVTE